MVLEQSVITEVENNVGWIKLNRPRSLNSLNIDMVDAIYKKLIEWKVNEDILIVCIYGDGDKGLCAGGDMRALYDLKENGVKDYAEQFFSTEYLMDYEIHSYPKPVVVYMDGVVMGGGVGLSIGASHRIVTERTKWAMPEMNIGFFPDVGASYFLNHMPGFTGRFLALTAHILTASDVLYIGAADQYMESTNWPAFKQVMKEKDWSPDSLQQDIDQLFKRYAVSSSTSTIESQQEKINQHFKFDAIEKILSSLRAAAINGDEWAEKTVITLLSKSPISLKVTLRQLQEGKEKKLHECFEMEMNLAMNFMTCHDFYEGVRSVLVDKDRNPKWKPQLLSELTNEQVSSFFYNPRNNEQSHLTAIFDNS